MAERRESKQAQEAKECHSALDGPECIQGVKPGKKPRARKDTAQRSASQSCDSALDAPECIEGISSSKQR